MYAKTYQISALLKASPDIVRGDVVLVPTIADYKGTRGKEIDYQSFYIVRATKNRLQYRASINMSLPKFDESGKIIIYLVKSEEREVIKPTGEELEHIEEMIQLMHTSNAPGWQRLKRILLRLFVA